jgi:transposase
MDRGIPTEEILEEMRNSKPPVSYLVGTPKGRLTKYEKELTQLIWQKVRDGVEVKLLPQDQEVYVFAQSHDRIQKERSMRRRQLKKLWSRLKKIKEMDLTTRELLLKLGAAENECPAAWRLVEITYPEPKQPELFRFKLNRQKMREAYRREGRYLLRTNLKSEDPASLWQKYIQLTQVEEAFRNLKGDLAIRPIYHQRIERIEAHIFVSFLAYCLHVTLRQKLRGHAPGLTPRSVLEKFATMQMIDVHLPTTDGRTIILPRYTQPDKDLQILLHQLGWTLPEQPPPRLAADGRSIQN